MNIPVFIFAYSYLPSLIRAKAKIRAAVGQGNEEGREDEDAIRRKCNSKGSNVPTAGNCCRPMPQARKPCYGESSDVEQHGGGKGFAQPQSVASYAEKHQKDKSE